MKNFIVLFILCINSVYSFSQIKIAQHVERVFNEDQKYDSLVNYPGENIFSLKGEDLYVLPPFGASSKERGYMGFYDSYKPHSKHYKNAGSIFTPAELIESKIFKVVDVKYRKAEYPETPYVGTGLSSEHIFFLALKCDNIQDTIYYEYTGVSVTFPFLCMGYYEKLKERTIGAEFYYKKRLNNTTKDYKTGESIELIPLSLWKCIDVVFDDNLGKMSLILINGNNTIIEANDYIHYYMISKSKGDIYKKKYGDMYIAAMNNMIKVGMAKELVEVAWGEPDKVNITPDLEQLIYRGKSGMKCVYIKNGKVSYFN